MQGIRLIDIIMVHGLVKMPSINRPPIVGPLDNTPIIFLLKPQCFILSFC